MPPNRPPNKPLNGTLLSVRLPAPAPAAAPNKAPKVPLPSPDHSGLDSPEDTGSALVGNNIGRIFAFSLSISACSPSVKYLLQPNPGVHLIGTSTIDSSASSASFLEKLAIFGSIGLGIVCRVALPLAIAPSIYSRCAGVILSN